MFANPVIIRWTVLNISGKKCHINQWRRICVIHKYKLYQETEKGDVIVVPK